MPGAKNQHRVGFPGFWLTSFTYLNTLATMTAHQDWQTAKQFGGRVLRVKYYSFVFLLTALVNGSTEIKQPEHCLHKVLFGPDLLRTLQPDRHLVRHNRRHS